MFKHIEKLLLAETHRPEWKKKQKMSFEGVFKKTDPFGIIIDDMGSARDRALKEVVKKFKKGSKVKVTVEEL